LFQIATILKMREDLISLPDSLDETRTVYLDDWGEGTNVSNFRNQTIYGGIKTAAFGKFDNTTREVIVPGGSKVFQQIKRSTLDDLQFDIEPLLKKGVFCKNGDDRDPNNFILDNIMFDFEDPQTQEKSYYGKLSLDQVRFGVSTSVHNILFSTGNSCMGQIKTQLAAPNTNKKHLILFFDRMNNVMNGNAEVCAEPIITIDNAVFANKGAIIRQGDIAGHFVYVSFKCPTETSKDIGNVIDKIYDNSNILSFDEYGKGKIHVSKEGFEKKLDAFLHRIGGIGIGGEMVDSVVNKFLENRMLLCGIKTEEIDNQVRTLQFLLESKQTLSEDQIIQIFSKPIFHDYIHLTPAELNKKIAQNATFFLYERIDTHTSLAGGASKKKSWSRSRRTKKHTNMSLKRLNKMKQENHPSIKKRSTSLKK
jgi:hypothetical protein